MSLNIELAERILDQITTFPESHNQNVYGLQAPDCDTAGCIAGWALLLSGEQIGWSDLFWRYGSGPARRMTMAGGNIERRAAELLGIDYGQHGSGAYGRGGGLFGSRRWRSDEEARDMLARMIKDAHNEASAL